MQDDDCQPRVGDAHLQKQQGHVERQVHRVPDGQEWIRQGKKRELSTMNFLERVKPLLCHEPVHMQVVGVSGRTQLCCAFCQHIPIPDIYQFVHQVSQQNLMGACELAQLYAEWTHDTMIPVPFAMVGIKGIFAKRIDGQPLYRLQSAVQILKALNAPFTENAVVIKPEQDFLADYLQAIEHAQHTQPLKPNEQMMLTQLVKNFHKLVDTHDENKFDFYFERLVPYVKACGQEVMLPPDEETGNLVTQLKDQLLRSQAIRQVYGKYSVPFDIFHVLVSCYACCADIDVVANWALDFMARLCRGEYFWKQYPDCKFVQHVLQVIKANVSYKHNTDLYWVVRAIQRGDFIDSFSENMRNYLQLEKLVRDKLQVPPELETLVMQQMFPSVLFESHAHLLAFTVASSHIAYCMDPKTGQWKKGTFNRARKMYAEIFALVNMVQEFEAKGDLPWTVDTLKLLLVSDANLEKRLTDLVKTCFEDSEEP